MTNIIDIEDVIEFKKIRMKQIASAKTDLAIIENKKGRTSEEYRIFKDLEKKILEGAKKEIFEMYIPENGVICSCSSEEIFELLGEYPTFNTSVKETWCVLENYNGYITNHEEIVCNFVDVEDATHFCNYKIGEWHAVTPFWCFQGTPICQESKVKWRFIGIDKDNNNNFLIEFRDIIR